MKKKMSASDREDLVAFERLCKRVEKLDSGATKYLRRLARNWNPNSWTSCGVHPFTPDGDLSRCFQWDRTGAGFPIRRWVLLWDRLEAGEA